MIEFTGNNFSFETFAYFSNEAPLTHINMGRIHFDYSPIGIEYVEGILHETDKEFVENGVGEGLYEIITAMRISSILKIKFKNGDEVICDDIKDMKISEVTVPPIDPMSRCWK